ncbi:MAG: TonB-dependent receptor [Sphingobium sp.]|nr:TonB-dependent receptor [Sphingobium sp.]
MTTVKRDRDFGHALRAALFTSCVGVGMLVASAPAVAQEAPAGDEAAPAEAIVITGSRIARQDYNSNSPIVTVGKELIEQSSTAAIEQNLNKLPQFTPAKTPAGGGDIQPTATNTPGAATVSLRGLGANRNLVLLDGRRATPSNAAGVVDINTIPSAAVERVEIISGGASATYGADAVAGVTNFILKKNFKGLELDAQTSIANAGDGFEYQVSGIMGTDFDEGKGNISIAMSMNTREASYQANRSWYKSLWADPNIGTNRFFPLYPGVALGSNGVALANESVFYNTLFPGTTKAFDSAGQPQANTISFAAVAPGASNFSVYVNPNGSLFTTGYNQRGGVGQFQGTTYQGDVAVKRATGALNFVDTTAYASLPLSRYNTFFRGNYEINDWIGVFAQGLYSSTETSTTQQGGAITSGWDVFVPYGQPGINSITGLPNSGVYTGSAIPDTAYGSQGNLSSVILNGMTYNGSAYVDPTPGNLYDNPTNPAFTKTYGSQFACAQNTTGGCTNYQVIGQYLPANIQTLLNARTNPNGRVELNYGFPQNRSVTNRVTTFNMLAGFQGKIPGTDWTWELFGNRGTTATYTRQTGVFSLTRLRTLLTSPGLGKGFSTNSNTASARPAFGANFASCTTGMNFFTTPWEAISQDCKNAITADLKNNQQVTQSIAEFNAQGSLFDLPAGTLKAAVGASYRSLKYEFINDTITDQGESFLDQALGIYPSSDSFGSYNVKEFYGELLVPVLKDVPAIKELSLELGARYSNYNTTGGSWTYKILGDWQVTDWLRIRGGYNRAQRSPNVAELFQSSSQIFGFNALGDLCSERATYRISPNPAAGGNTAANAADVKATCAAVMNRTGGPDTASQYYQTRPLSQQPAPAGGFAWTNATGNPNLKPETVDTWTAGLVVQSPFQAPLLQRLRFTVDWYSIKLKDAIGLQGAGTALQQCLDPFWNTAVAGAANGTTFNADNTVTLGSAAIAAANNPYCKGIRYDPLPALGAANSDVTYYNNGVVDIQGLDAQVDWAAKVGPGTFNVNFLLNYYLHYRSKELANNPLVDYVGTLGTAQNALNPGAFRYRILTTFGYGIGPVNVSLQWQHLPSVLQEGAALAPTVINGFPSYDLFNLNMNVTVTKAVRMRMGVDNVFNKAPPIGGVNTTANVGLGQLPGGGFNSSFYDINGRRYYLGVTAKF